MKLLMAMMMMAGAQLGAHMIMPALPQISRDLAIGSGESQQIILLYFFAFGLSQLLLGPLSDSLGRRKIFILGQALFVLGSLLACFAHSPNELMFGRVLQGLGAGAPLIISRVLLSDAYRGKALSQALASLGICTTVAAVMAPILGGVITSWLNWHSVFALLAVYLGITLIMGMLVLKDKPTDKRTDKTRQKPNSQGPANSSALQNMGTSLANILRQYLSFSRDPYLLSVAAYKWLISLLMLSSLAFMPFELQGRLGLSAAQYSYALLLPSLAPIMGSVLIKLCLRYYSAQWLLLMFSQLILVAGLIFILAPFTLFNMMLAYAIFLLALGASFACVMQLLVSPYPQQAGAVTAYVGAIEMLVFSSLAIQVNAWFINDVQALGILYVAAFSLMLVCWWGLWRQGNSEQNTGLKQA